MGQFTVEIDPNGLQRLAPSEFNKSGLVLGGVAATDLALNTVSEELSNLQAVEALGITQGFDEGNEIQVWYHCKEFFRLSKAGKLRIMMVPQGTTLTQMCDKDNDFVQKMVVETGGRLRRIGVVLNPADGYTPTLSDGYDADVVSALPKAQELVEANFDQMRPLEIGVEGRDFNGTPGAMTNFRTSDYPYVQIVNIQDPGAVGVFDTDAKSGAVGTFIGAKSFVNANESIGYTGKVNLSDNVTGEFASVNFTSGEPSSTYELDYQTFADKGVVIGRTYPGQSGVYFDTNATCGAIDSDFAYAQEVSVMFDAVRRLYDGLFPRINGPVKIDSATGQMDPETAKAIEADADAALDIMIQEELISDRKAYVDPENDVDTNGVIVQVELVNVATGRKITLKIKFTKTLG